MRPGFLTESFRKQLYVESATLIGLDALLMAKLLLCGASRKRPDLDCHLVRVSCQCNAFLFYECKHVVFVHLHIINHSSNVFLPELGGRIELAAQILQRCLRLCIAFRRYC